MNRTISNPGVSIDDSILHELLTMECEDSQTIVFCNYISKTKYINGGWINIHPTTYLVNESESLQMLYAMNVPVAPRKHQFQKSGEYKRFALIFPPIPKSWKHFDFIESCSSGDGFYVDNISRNNSGIYEIYLK